MMILAVAATIILGYLGTVFGNDLMNWPQAGPIAAIATMGAFLLAALKKNGSN